jgi:hypothetical protein
MVKWSESACFALMPAVANRVNAQQPKTTTEYIFPFLRNVIPFHLKFSIKSTINSLVFLRAREVERF